MSDKPLCNTCFSTQRDAFAASEHVDIALGYANNVTSVISLVSRCRHCGGWAHQWAVHSNDSATTHEEHDR